MRGDDPKAIVGAWSTCRRVLFAPHEPFQALSYAVLDHEVVPAKRERFRLELDRPGRAATEVMTTDHSPPGLDALPRKLALQVRALGANAGQGRLAVLIGLYNHRPDWQVDELARLLEVSVKTIQANLEQLRAQGSI